MKVIVERAGHLSSDAPVSGARKEEVVWVDIRAVSSLEQVKHEKLRRTWLTEGTNHRMVDGFLARDFLRPMWVIEIDDLYTFLKEHGACRMYANPNGMLNLNFDDA